MTIEILSVNTILLIYRRCSIWPPPTSIHFVYRLIMSCRTLGKIPSISRMTPAATRIVPQNLLSPRESRTLRFSYIPINGNPIVSGHVSAGGRLLDLYVQSICCQKCNSSGDTTRSCGTNTTSC